jgi:hypothetical protein
VGIESSGTSGAPGALMSNCVTKNKTEHGISKLSHLSAQFLQWFSGFTDAVPYPTLPYPTLPKGPKGLGLVWVLSGSCLGLVWVGNFFDFFSAEQSFASQPEITTYLGLVEI